MVPGEIDVDDLPVPKEPGQFPGAKKAGKKAPVVFKGFRVDERRPGEGERVDDHVNS
jgi:hypothetical protein